MSDGDTKNLTPDQLREQRLQRNLKILVVGLGILIIACLAVVVAKIFTLSSSAPVDGTRQTVTAPVATPGGELALEIPKGARVVSVSLSGNRLAVHHEGPAGAGIAIIDLDTGRRITDVKPLEAVPRN